ILVRFGDGLCSLCSQSFIPSIPSIRACFPREFRLGLGGEVLVTFAPRGGRCCSLVGSRVGGRSGASQTHPPSQSNHSYKNRAAFTAVEKCPRQFGCQWPFPDPIYEPINPGKSQATGSGGGG